MTNFNLVLKLSDQICNLIDYKVDLFCQRIELIYQKQYGSKPFLEIEREIGQTEGKITTLAQQVSKLL